jgi:hypothetical protein
MATGCFYTAQLWCHGDDAGLGGDGADGGSAYWLAAQ